MKYKSALCALLLAVATSGCGASTKLTAAWKEPTAPTPISFKKTIVAFQNKNESLRRSVEDAMAARIGNATPSYTLLTTDAAKDPEKAKVAVKAAGFDGAVVSRVASVDKQTTYVPGTTWWGPAPYGSMWGYWGYGWGAVYDPGYLAQDTVVSLETLVYSVDQDKLLWASRSETFNPTSAESLVKSVADATVKEMKKQKVL